MTWTINILRFIMLQRRRMRHIGPFAGRESY